MPSQITLHLDPCTVNSRKTLASLIHLRVPYTLQKVSYFAGEHRTPSFRALNPCATLPCAVIDKDLVLTESNAITLYAAEVADSPAYPLSDAKKRADINRWLFWEASVWFPACYTYLVQNVAQPLLGGEPDRAVLEAQEPRWKELAGVLEGRLVENEKKGGQGQAWICGTGEEPTVADLAVAASMHLWRLQGLPLEGFPAVGRWMARVEGLECWRKTQGDVESVLGGGANGGK